MSKFIDLEPQVSDYYGTTPGQERRAGICDALRYLDSHPDQVPGRTITDSDLGRAADNLLMSEAAGEFSSGVRRLALELGLTVTPDPEPTNAEKLAQLHDQYTRFPVQHLPGNGSFADYLDHNGVKAPGGDDE